MDCAFTLKHYRETLVAYRKAGYAVTSFEGALKSLAVPDKILILRHDVDFTLKAALCIAQIEAEEGCLSTFFLRLHAKGYNLMSLDNYRTVKAIAGMKHELGLHFEPAFARAVGEDPLLLADRQKTIIEDVLGKSIIGISTHEPSREGDSQLIKWLSEHWQLAYHAYEDRFTREMKYISDSGGRWREGCFCHCINRVDRFQVLIHPFWWYEETPMENY